MDQQQLATELLQGPIHAVEQAGFFVSLCTVYESGTSADALGQVDLTTSGFTALAGCVNIPCIRAAISMLRLQAGEIKAVDYTQSFNLFHVLLDGYYPQIPEAIARGGQLRAIIDGVPHQVVGAESSSQLAPGGQTRLACHQVVL